MPAALITTFSNTMMPEFDKGTALKDYRGEEMAQWVKLGKQDSETFYAH